MVLSLLKGIFSRKKKNCSKEEQLLTFYSQKGPIARKADRKSRNLHPVLRLAWKTVKSPVLIFGSVTKWAHATYANFEYAIKTKTLFLLLFFLLRLDLSLFGFSWLSRVCCDCIVSWVTSVCVLLHICFAPPLKRGLFLKERICSSLMQILSF